MTRKGSKDYVTVSVIYAHHKKGMSRYVDVLNEYNRVVRLKLDYFKCPIPTHEQLHKHPCFSVTVPRQYAYDRGLILPIIRIPVE